MKKRLFAVFAVLVCVLALAGCRTMVLGERGDFDMDEIAKAQKIVVADASGQEKAVLETEEEIDAFVKAITVENWDFAELPEGAEKAGSFTLWQQATVKAFLGEKETKTQEICTFVIYDQDYLTIETGVMNLNFTFSVPASVGAYLRELAA